MRPIIPKRNCLSLRSYQGAFPVAVLLLTLINASPDSVLGIRLRAANDTRPLLRTTAERLSSEFLDLFNYSMQMGIT